MLGETKKRLIEEPEKLKQFLEAFGFGHVKIHRTYLSFGHDETTSPKSVTIRLENNNYCYVTDYSWNINKELFSYVMDVRGIKFIDVINVLKAILDVSDIDNYKYSRRAFGGFYDAVKDRKTPKEIKVIDNSELDQFEDICNLKFLRDNISLEAQKHFHLMFDKESNGIVIPIYSGSGQLMGVKERCNYESDDPDFQKYWYKIPCLESNTLYGYADNYNYLTGGTVMISESEKAVMQAYSYGFRNMVGLGSGTLSLKQTEMILELNPKEVIFLHDQGFQREAMERNFSVLQNYIRYMDIKIGYWDWSMGEYESKVSPTDLGRCEFERILENEIKYIDEDYS